MDISGMDFIRIHCALQAKLLELVSLLFQSLIFGSMLLALLLEIIHLQLEFLVFALNLIESLRNKNELAKNWSHWLELANGKMI
jgi:uncharacterized membrane protein YcgQ (UPF0703/DUF1980 family)